MALEYLKANLILGEGKSDAAFFHRLFLAHNLQDFQSDYPVLGKDFSGGWSKIGEYLLGISIAPTFIANVKRVVVVGDHDDANSFSNLCGQLAHANYSVPSAPKKFVTTSGKPDVAILLIPDAPPGCLETLCYAAAATKWSTLVAPLSSFLAATPAIRWSSTKQDKMKVQCLLASTCEKDPAVALKDHWQKPVQYHIPVNDPAFNSVAGFLTSI